jgi:hypothetical protein
MESILILAKIWLVCWTITRFEPLQMVLELLPNKLIPNLFTLMITCLRCLTLWATLIYTGDLFLACLLSFISFFYDKFIGPIERKVKL